MFESLKVDKKFAEQINFDISHSRLSHAVILEGGDEADRSQVAMELAQAILCTGDPKPCGNCRACRKVMHSSHPDLHIIEKDESATMIKVDEIRELKQTAQLLPNDGEKAVFIIIEAQYMNPQAQNALLKIFEEPSEHVNFILTCPSKSAFLETIISRGTSYSLSANDNVEIETETTKAAFDLAVKMVNALCNGNEYDFMTLVAGIKKDKELLRETNKKLSTIFRDALIASNGLNTFINPCTAEIQKLSRTFDTNRLLNFIEQTKYIDTRIKANANFNILTTEFCSNFFKR